MSGPLHGLRVLEAAQVMSGPLCGMLLAEQGADVIKIEQPGGDPTRLSGTRRAGMGAMFFNCNRGKRSVIVDLTRPAGRDLVVALARTADVFIQNFRPGKAARMGIGPEALLEANPSLVYASISGVGDDGPDVDRPVYDFVIQAMIGLADLQRDASTGRAQLVKTYLVDKATAACAAQAITAALLARERHPDRAGQHVAVSMLDAGLAFFWPDGMMDRTFLDRDGDHDEVPNNLEFYDAYPTSDGAVALMPIIPGFFAAMARACGHPEWIDDPRFADLAVRRRHFADLARGVADAVAGMTTAEAMARFRAEDVPAAEVVGRDRVHDQDQISHQGSLVEACLDPVGRVRVPVHPARFERSAAHGPRPAPGPGEHTLEVLTELGLDPVSIERLLAEGVAHPGGGPPAAANTLPA